MHWVGGSEAYSEGLSRPQLQGQQADTAGAGVGPRGRGVVSSSRAPAPSIGILWLPARLYQIDVS